FVDAGDGVDEPFDRAQRGIEPGLLAVEHPRQEPAERLRHRENRDEEDQDLQPTIARHVRTSPAAAARTSGTRAGRPSQSDRRHSRGSSNYSRRSHAATYATASRKNATVMPTYSRSSMESSVSTRRRAWCPTTRSRRALRCSDRT